MSSSLMQGLRVGAIATLFGLMACGQSDAPNASGSSAPADAVPMATVPTATAVRSSESSASTPAPVTLSAGLTADRIDREIERMLSRDCDFSQKEEGGVEYTLCKTLDELDFPFVLMASSILVPEGSGFRYWFQDNGDLYIIERIEPAAANGRTVLVDDRQTVIYFEGQGEPEVFVDSAQWQQLSEESWIAMSAIRERFDSELMDFSNISMTGTQLPMATVTLARTGGDFNHRWATFVVPQSDTSESAYGGALRWYDAHIATMVAMTADQFCGRPSDRGAYFNYEADDSAVFMGQIFVSCATARSVMETYGRGRHTWVVLDEGGMESEVFDVWIPELPDGVVSQFQQTVLPEFTPECIEPGGTRICPGDRLL
ncbi:hypothetical protein [Egbenema bharatensis]|uniref:hypothetical protein n=1 Tax=Egbenema bharatensis TaxID=3463334 RepID=UPI003A83EE00